MPVKTKRNARYKQPREKTLGALTIFHRVEILDKGMAALKLRMLKSSCYDKAETDGDAREQGTRLAPAREGAVASAQPATAMRSATPMRIANTPQAIFHAKVRMCSS